MGYAGGADVEHPEHIHAEDRVELLGGVGVQGGGWIDPGDVRHRVDTPTEGGDEFGECGLDGGPVADIGDDRVDPLAAGNVVAPGAFRGNEVDGQHMPNRHQRSARRSLPPCPRRHRSPPRPAARDPPPPATKIVDNRR